MAQFLMLLAGTILTQQADPAAQKSAEAACATPYKSPIKVTASQNTQSLRTTASQVPGASEDAISTKGTGTAGKAAASPEAVPDGAAETGKPNAPANITKSC